MSDNPRQRRPARQTLQGLLCGGFSLWELAIALTVLTGLATAILSLAPQLVHRTQTESQARLLPQVERQLLGFAVANGRLPCPDSDGDGIENCAVSGPAALPYKTLGLGGADFGHGRIAMRYGVYRNATASADLARLVDRFNPTDADGMVRTLNQTNTLDLCNALDNAAAAAGSATLLHTRDASGVDRNVAYAVAVAGLTDADGASGNFDGLNSMPGFAYEAPNRAPGSGYDDVVMTRSFAALAVALSCDTVRLSLDSLANAVAVTDEVADQAAGAASGALIGSIMNGTAVLLIGINTTLAGIAVASASTTIATASAELAAAIAACVASLGLACGAIAAPAAALALAIVGLAAASAALVLDVGALVSQLVATGLYIAVTIRANAAATGGSALDLNAAVTQLTAALASANADLAQAQADEQAALTAAANAQNSLNTTRTGLLNSFTALDTNNGGTLGADAATALQAAQNAVVALDQARVALQDAQAQAESAQSDVDSKTSTLAVIQAQKTCIDMGNFYDFTTTPAGCRALAPTDPTPIPIPQSQVTTAAQNLANAQAALAAANAAVVQAQNQVNSAQNTANSTRATAELAAFNAAGSDVFLGIQLLQQVDSVLALQNDLLVKQRAASAATAARVKAQARRDSLAANLTQIQCLAAGNLFDATTMTCNPPPTGPSGTASTLFSGATAILQAADNQGLAQ